jgi:hypothetical protein
MMQGDRSTAGLARVMGTLGGLGLAVLTAAAAAQEIAVIDLTNVRIQHGLNQSRTSAPQTISPANRYHYVIDGMVRGSGGVMGLMFPSPVPLAQVMETLSPGSSAALTGYAYNCAETHPFGVSGLQTSGQTELLGITVTYAMTLATGIDAANIAYFSLTNVTLSPALLVGSLLFTSGSATLTRAPFCYANCDESTTAPILNVEDFSCFINRFAVGDAYANCDCSTTEPVLNVEDFSCFINKFAAGCP